MVRLITCDSCGTSLMLEDDVSKVAGEQGVMHDAPLLFGLGDTVKLGRETIRLLGHARFSYGPGFWDEFWGVNEINKSRWVSIDEGDIVVQQPLPLKSWPEFSGKLRVGREFRRKDEIFTIREVDVAECIALLGSFDETLTVGETYQFANAMSDGGTLLSFEVWEDGQNWFSEWDSEQMMGFPIAVEIAIVIDPERVSTDAELDELNELEIEIKRSVVHLPVAEIIEEEEETGDSGEQQ